jgi:molybdopterin/thiamine biosynthesis adenylyltransferase
MGWHHFRVWDLDIVESHNLPNQIYDNKHIGMKKVDAFKEILLRFNPHCIIETNDIFYTSHDFADSMEGAVFIAVDSLKARKDIMQGLKLNPMIDLILETKMGFTHAEMNFINPLDSKTINNYIEMLKDDKDVEESACNARIITTLVTIVSSNLVHELCTFYKNTSKNEQTKKSFKTIYDIKDFLKTFTIKGEKNE